MEGWPGTDRSRQYHYAPPAHMLNMRAENERGTGCMATISLCMIVKNEEQVLARCLDSVKSFADEIVIVDTGSADRTKEIAGAYTDRVYDFEWKDDFSAARNAAFSKAGMDYCMWLDADDVVSEDSQKRIKELKEQITPDVSVVMMKYVTAFDGEGRPAFLFDRERLVKNHAGFVWRGRVHEVIEPAGRIIYSDILIEHRSIKQTYSTRNLDIYETMLREGETLEPRHQFYYGRELYYHGRDEQAIEVFSSYLNGENGAGWIENQIDACRFKAYCHERLGQEEETLLSLLRTFQYDVPRPETCCDLGKYFLDRNRLDEAVFWYRQALGAGEIERPGAFINAKCSTYIPAIQLAVCLDRLRRREEAFAYNELAASYEPDSTAVAQNREYFRRILTCQK